MQTVCSIGAYDCRNYQSAIDKAAQICQGWMRPGCIKDICSMGSYNCRNYASAIDKAAKLCRQQH